VAVADGWERHKRLISHSRQQYSHELGLKNIQKVLSEKYGFCDAKRGGGIWVGKPYGKGTERYGGQLTTGGGQMTVASWH